MRMLSLVLLTFGLSIPASAELLFIDLNDAPKEIEACQKGAGTKGEAVHVIGRSQNEGKCIKGEDIERKIAELEAQGVVIDGYIISGHDGNGHFFGENTEGGCKSEFRYTEMKAIFDRHPTTKASLTTAGLWGCYTANLKAGRTFWVTPVPNMQLSLGFGVKGPLKWRKDNHALLEGWCRDRKDLADLAQKDQLAEVYKRLNITTDLIHPSVCSRKAVADPELGDKVEYTDKELKDLCKNFDLNENTMSRGETLEEFSKYFNADLPKYENPPDGEKGNKLREYYNKLQLWSFCFKPAKGTNGLKWELDKKNLPPEEINSPPYITLHPASVIRLIKYKHLKENISKLNKHEIADYDKTLKELGLSDDFLLGDISKLSRHDLEVKLTNTKAEVERLRTLQASRPPYDMNVVVEMVDNVKRSLIDMDWTCNDFTIVDDVALKRDWCVNGYAGTKLEMEAEAKRAQARAAAARNKKKSQGSH